MADCAACGRSLAPGAGFCRGCGAGTDDARGLATFALPRDADEPTTVIIPDLVVPPAARDIIGSAPEAPSPRRVTRRRWAVAGVGLLLVGAVAGIVAVRPDRTAGPPPLAAGTPPTSAAQTAVLGPDGDVPVQLASAVRSSPYAQHVRLLFADYFGAINARDYPRWAGTLSRERKVDPPEKFRIDYSTTVDDDIRIVGINERPDGGLLVALSFRSRQDPAHAPPELPVACLRWQIVYPLVDEDGHYKIALVRPTNRSFRAC
ncbi:MAG TPA: hypothetical protein VLJ59_16680 [Mycobacteriales bacterium]|nr:hypothetical protein [Mycobacteriales bacterium]